MYEVLQLIKVRNIFYMINMSMKWVLENMHKNFIMFTSCDQLKHITLIYL